MLPGTVALAGAAHNDESQITLSYVGAATSSTSSISAPGGIASGDLGIYIDYGQGSGSRPSSVTPSGHTNFLNLTGGVEHRLMISYKVLTGSETTITGMNGADTNSKCFLVYRPSSAITAVAPLAGASWKQQIITTADPSAQSTVMVGKAAPLIFIGITASGAGTPAFTTASPAFDGTHGVVGDMLVGRKLYNGEPQNHTIDAADLGNSNTLVSGYIQVN